AEPRWERFMRTLLVVASALLACDSPPRRANGDGFTLTLPSEWRAEPVDEGYLFRAVRSKGTLEIAQLRDDLHDVISDDARCAAWIESTAATLRGHLVSASLQNGTCRGHIRGMGTFLLYAQARATKVYVAMCNGVDSLEKDCSAILETWVDDPTSKPQRREPRLTLSHENGKTVVRTASFAMSFPTGWGVVEGSGKVLLQATSEKGLFVSLVATNNLGTFRRAECDGLGPVIAEQYGVRVISTTLVDTPAGHACRVSIGESLIRWSYAVTAPDGQSYLFACGAQEGEAPQALCESILASWIFTPRETSR
ncbi:MAG: hypothetical protein ACKV2T_40135, partial [Kofleriaceae bacterium]